MKRKGPTLTPGGLRRAACAAILVLGGCASPPPAARTSTAAEPGVSQTDSHQGAPQPGDGYYLTTCAACPSLLGAHGSTVDRCYDGRDVRFCCEDCHLRFDRDVAEGMNEVDRRMIADQLPHYPMNTSVVSGRALGDHPLDCVVGNRLFRVVNAAERDELTADVRRYFDILDRAVIEAQRPHYGMPDKCPVQGDILANDVPIDFVVANRMIRVCCPRCVRVVKSRPSQYLSMIDYANRTALDASRP